MDWKQIETKWGAMARRCRADVICGKVDDDVVVLRRVTKSEAANSVAVKRIATGSIVAAQNRDPVSTH